MRIISGDLKGKKLLTPLDKSTRPLKDMVRESIFNILDHSSKVSAKINNSKLLDLFSLNIEESFSIAMGVLELSPFNDENPTKIAFTFILDEFDGAIKIKAHHSSPIIS